MSTSAPQTRHTVTAIIVAHDGARLLPGLVQALQAQTYAVERVVGVDTGSRDRSGSVLAELIGHDSVFGMDRNTGYGEAVAVALRHTAARLPAGTDPNIRRVEWIWLLHDDCEPTPETLEHLLRAASRDRSVVVLGPKVLDGSDRRVLREVGIAVDRAGRRITGIEPGEIDQGQHDANRAVMAVGSAGMLIRRDVWDRLGGFDTRLKLFRDDLDFCWRVQAAGLRVQVVTDAVLYHRELSSRRRRTAEGSHPRKLDRRNALYVLAVNLPLLTMLRVLAGCVAGSLVRAAYFLLTKQLDLAAAQIYAVAGLFGHPVWLWKGRRRRAAGHREGYSAVRMFIPSGRALSRMAEGVAGLLSSGPPQASGGLHHATSEEADDEQFVDSQSVVRRIVANPGVQLVAALVVIALVAERRLLGTSPLGGGALVPAWGGASSLWREYLAGFHAVGVGSTATASPYLAVVAALATVLGGQAWLAVDVLLLGCVPLAGLTAYLAARRLVTSTAARLWLAGTYALLPVATGAIASGRLGSAFVFALLPLIGISAARILTSPPRSARRAAWATGLLVGLAAAFVPLMWIFGVAFAVAVLAVRLVPASWQGRLVAGNRESESWLRPVHPLNAAIVAATPFVILFPWSLHLLASPRGFFAEAGVLPPGLSTTTPKPTALLALSPGGPGLPPVWITAGIALAVLAAVLPHRRSAVTMVGWCVAAAGFLGAIAVSRASTPAEGGQASTGWPGAALAVAAVGLLVAAAPAADWLAKAGVGRGLARRLLTGLALAAAATAPVLAAGYWLHGGVRGPVGTVSAPVLPAFVSASSDSGTQYRTLILRQTGGSFEYWVVRQGDPTLGEPELTASTPAEQALSQQVAALLAPDGADAGDPGTVLGDFGIRWVMLPGPVDPTSAQRLDAAVGLMPVSKAPAYDLWQVTGPVARVRVIAPNGTVTKLASQSVGMQAVTAPASGGTLMLAEPYGGWTATLNGTALKPLAAPVDGWAQGFVLPAGGGRLVITRNNVARNLSLLVELLALLAICVLALPGKRAEAVVEPEAVAAVRASQHSKRAARAAQRPGRARRGARGVPAVAGTGRAARAAGLAARAGLAGRAGLTGRAAGRGGARKRGAGRGAAAEPPDSRVSVLSDVDELDQTGAHGQWDDDGPWDQENRWDQESQWDDADQADRGTGRWDDTGTRHDAGQRDDASQWVDSDHWESNDHWDSGAQWDRPAPLTGPRSAAANGTGPRPALPRATGPQPRARRGTGSQPAADWETSQEPVAPWETSPHAAADRGSGPQPIAPWESGPQTAADWGTGPQQSWQTGPQPSQGTGPQETWQNGPRPAQGTGPQESWETGPRPAQDPSPRRNSPPERHSHRGGRHGRRRGTGDRSGRGGDS